MIKTNSLKIGDSICLGDIGGSVRCNSLPLILKYFNYELVSKESFNELYLKLKLVPKKHTKRLYNIVNSSINHIKVKINGNWKSRFSKRVKEQSSLWYINDRNRYFMELVNRFNNKNIHNINNLVLEVIRSSIYSYEDNIMSRLKMLFGIDCDNFESDIRQSSESKLFFEIKRGTYLIVKTKLGLDIHSFDNTFINFSPIAFIWKATEDRFTIINLYEYLLNRNLEEIGYIEFK